MRGLTLCCSTQTLPTLGLRPNDLRLALILVRSSGDPSTLKKRSSCCYALTGAPGMTEAQKELLSCGRVRGIGPKVMKRAAAKIGIVFERQVHRHFGGQRTYWRIPAKAA